MRWAWCLYVSAGIACKEPEPRFNAPQTLGGVEVSAEVLNAGARVYALRCVSCHGVDGSGNGPAGRALQHPPRDFREGEYRYKSTPGAELPLDSDLAATIVQGRLENGMPAWPMLPPEDLHAVIQYVKTFSSRWTGDAVSP